MGVNMEKLREFAALAGGKTQAASKPNHTTNYNAYNSIRPPNVGLLLSKLEGVKQAGPGKYQARCPAHPDKSPSLAIKHDDDAILVHCFAGCATESVLSAIGLSFSDLYPQRVTRDYDPTKPCPKAPRFNRYELFDLLLQEALILALAYREAWQTATLLPTDLQRANQAFAAVIRLNDEVRR